MKIEHLLNLLQLEIYTDLFVEKQINISMLRQCALEDAYLKNIGVRTEAHRQKILAAQDILTWFSDDEKAIEKLQETGLVTTDNTQPPGPTTQSKRQNNFATPNKPTQKEFTEVTSQSANRAKTAPAPNYTSDAAEAPAWTQTISGSSQPDTNAQRKTKRGLWIGLTVATLVGGIAFAVYPSFSEKSKTKESATEEEEDEANSSSKKQSVGNDNSSSLTSIETEKQIPVLHQKLIRKTEDWNTALNNRSLDSYHRMLANTVAYYNRLQSADQAKSRKGKTLSRNPSFAQKLIGDIEVEKLQEDLYKASFTKETTVKGKPQTVSGYLFFINIDNQWKIAAEGDETTILYANSVAVDDSKLQHEIQNYNTYSFTCDRDAVHNLSPKQRFLARHEIFARHGKYFQSKWIQSHFSKQSWYQQNSNYSDRLLTQRDADCITLIKRTEGIFGTYDDSKEELWVPFKANKRFSVGRADGDTRESPVHTVYVGDFSMMKTEVTVTLYKECVREAYCSAPSLYKVKLNNYCTYSRGNSQAAMNCVSWSQATEFCSWMGGRLPTEAEWEYAATSGGKSIRFPWGNTPDWGCNKAVLALGRANNSGAKYPSNRGCGYNEVFEVCSKTAGNTDQGLCDMAGNLWEWTANCDEVYNSSCSKKVQRGGGFWSNAQQVRATRRSFDTDRGLMDVGFRCVR